LGAFTQIVETANAEACATTAGEDAIIAQLNGRSLARFYRNRTRQRLLRRELKCAIQDIDRAVAIDPENAFGHIMRGSVYSRKDQFELAMQDLEQGIKLASQGLVSTDDAGYDHESDLQIGRPRAIMAWAHFERGSIHLKRHEDEQALNDFNDAIRLSPRYVAAYLGRGASYQRKGDYTRAIDDFGQAIKLHPTSVEAYNGRCSVNAKLGNMQAATADCDEALRLRSDVVEHIVRGNIYATNDQLELAMRDFEEAIKLASQGLVSTDGAGYDHELDPRIDYQRRVMAGAYCGRGSVHLKEHDHEHALNDFNEAIRLSPRYDAAYLVRGAAYRSEGEYARAVDDFSQAIELNPTNAAAHNCRCYVYAIVGNLNAALADCNEALRLWPNAAHILDSRGFTYLKMGDLDRAIADFDAALLGEPKIAQSLYGRGVAKRMKGDAEAAERDIADALTVKPDIAEEMARYGVK
jgi:tetratricopeptide (TPR) repeat protein